MIKHFSPEIVNQVLGYVHDPTVDGCIDDCVVGVLRRTPLHIDFSPGVGWEDSRKATTIEDEVEFNSVGSRVDRTDELGQLHLPVIDADGGIYVPGSRLGKKAELHAIKPVKGNAGGYYGPNSQLRDVLGDNGIDVEVFLETTAHPILKTVKMGHYVSAIVMRAASPGTFNSFDSTTEGRGHLYINHPFSEADHKVLIEELAIAGLIESDYSRLVGEFGMGIVRTPWTDKKETDASSVKG